MTEDKDHQFLTRLRRCVDRAGDAASLARRVGVSAGTMAAYLAGRTSPRRETILAIANVARVAPAWLLDGSPPQPELLPHEEGSRDIEAASHQAAAALAEHKSAVSEAIKEVRQAQNDRRALVSGATSQVSQYLQSHRGFSGEPYEHQPGPPVPVEPPPPPAAPIVSDDLLVELFHRVAALYLSERLPSSTEGELRDAVALYNELVAAHGPGGPSAATITARLTGFRDWLRREREGILRGGRES